MRRMTIVREIDAMLDKFMEAEREVRRIRNAEQS